MISKIKKNKIFIVLMILQLLGVAYWMDTKANFFVDELYSKGYASTYTGAGDRGQYITTCKDWEVNEWKNVNEYKKYLIVSEEEQITKMSPLQAIKKIATSRNYFAFLNFAETVGGNESISKEPGIILNALLLILSEIVLIAISLKLNMGKKAIAFLVAMFGFCGYFVGIVQYIRFYMLITLMALIIIWFHLIIWKSEQLWGIILCEVGSAILVYLAMKNSELTVAFAGAFIGCFCLAVMIRKKWKALWPYIIMVLAGIIYLGIATPYLRMLLDAKDYASAGGVGAHYVSNVLNVSLKEFTSYVLWVGKLITDYFFGHPIILLIWIIGMSSFIYINRNVLKEGRLNENDGFVLILVGTYFIYTIFIGIAGFNVSRYYIYGFISFVLFFWYFIARLIDMKNIKWQKYSFGILSVLVVMSCTAPYITRNIEYIYEEDEELKEALQDYQGVDTILVTAYLDEKGTISRHEVYDCVNMLEDNTQICPVLISEKFYENIQVSDELLLWTHNNRVATVEEINEEMRQKGYEVQHIGSNHISTVYIWKKGM